MTSISTDTADNAASYNAVPLTLPERGTFADRFFAQFADTVVVNIPLRLVGLLLTMLFGLINGGYLNLLLLVIVYFWYFCYYPSQHDGQTPGKQWNKLRIVKSDGEGITLGGLLLRNLIKDGPFLIPYILFGSYWGYLWVLTYLLALSQNRLALHDMIARTQVVRVTTLLKR